MYLYADGKLLWNFSLITSPPLLLHGTYHSLSNFDDLRKVPDRRSEFFLDITQEKRRIIHCKPSQLRRHLDRLDLTSASLLLIDHGQRLRITFRNVTHNQTPNHVHNMYLHLPFQNILINSSVLDCVVLITNILYKKMMSAQNTRRFLWGGLKLFTVMSQSKVNLWPSRLKLPMSLLAVTLLLSSK